MKTAEIVSPWIGSGTLSDPYRPRVDAMFTLKTCVDATGQPNPNIPPRPNLAVFRVTCEDAVLASVVADGRFRILHSEADQGEPPAQTEFDGFRSYLTARGATTAERDAAAGTTIAGRTRARVTDDCRAYLRTRPRQGS